MSYYRAERDLTGDRNILSNFHDITLGTEIYTLRTSSTQHFVGYFIANNKWVSHYNVEVNDYLKLLNRIWPNSSPSYTLKIKIKSLDLQEFNGIKNAKFIDFIKNNIGEVRASNRIYKDVIITGHPEKGDVGLLIKPLIGPLIFYKQLI